MNVVIIGCGYVGLVTGATFAHFGHRIAFIDTDEHRIGELILKRCPIYEPRLAELLLRNDRRINYFTDVQDAIRSVDDADLVFFCVGTPATSTGATDRSALKAACEAVRPALSKRTTVVVKSTVPAGTGTDVAHWLRIDSRRVWSNPEFLKEGSAVTDALRPDRVVLGGHGYEPKLDDLYRPFVRTDEQIVWVKRESAEILKYANNAMLASRISLMNEIARLCDDVGADVHEVRRGVGADERIGSAFLYAGASFGGSCFSKDVDSLRHQLQQAGATSHMAEAILKANIEQRCWFRDRIIGLIDASDTGLPMSVAVWGLAFKPETDDVRDAPALEYVLAASSAADQVLLYDPVAMENFMRTLTDLDSTIDNVQCADSAYEAAKHASILVLCTEWPEFRRPDFRHLRALMASPAVLVDGRNIWSRDTVESLGFTYLGVGR